MLVDASKARQLVLLDVRGFRNKADRCNNACLGALQDCCSPPSSAVVQQSMKPTMSVATPLPPTFCSSVRRLIKITIESEHSADVVAVSLPYCTPQYKHIVCHIVCPGLLLGTEALVMPSSVNLSFFFCHIVCSMLPSSAHLHHAAHQLHSQHRAANPQCK